MKLIKKYGVKAFGPNDLVFDLELTFELSILLKLIAELNNQTIQLIKASNNFDAFYKLNDSIVF